MNTLTLDDLCNPAPPTGAADWNPEGVVILEGFMPSAPILAYQEEWADCHKYLFDTFPPPIAERRQFAFTPGGWPDATPYMRYPALRELVCDGPLGKVLEMLLGEPAGVHLNLTGWETTARDWHQDQYLNEPCVGDFYAAVWFALGDVHPDSGPFQYIPGSHRWPQVDRTKIKKAMGWEKAASPQWPKHSEDILTPLFEQIIEPADVVTYLPKAGDVLIWHGRLLHRGSRANVPGAYRPSLIAHYSGVNHRTDMPPAMRHKSGGYFFPLGGTTPVR